ncbi:Trp biosynthesis protein [Xylanimonas oleitrophica]|uniref:Trp biosynthesis protein n=1 Tax=Xylanimonas oleitrophica TaxID=2607479 RepID=A0A2W5Y3Q2_9MICO|nr:Trp biosynthesis-associated membrane protein [Xylanimonas oleitrophica]PZR52474.1 Trp biosynthesis protein [Xylanimonas oleitrophica]
MSGGARAGLTRARATWSVILVGALVLATAAPVWVRSQVDTALEAAVPVEVSGGSAAPAVNAAGLVLVAAGLALALGGRVARWVVLAVVAASGALVAGSAYTVVAGPSDVATTGAADAAGVTELTAPVTVTAWPWLCAALGVLAIVLAVLVAVASRAWPAASGRHERAGAPAGAPAAGVATGAPAGPVADLDDDSPVDSHDAWDALTRGTDPTGSGPGADDR